MNGVATVFFDVAYQSYLPSLVDRDQLVEGNAKLEVSRSGAQILGRPDRRRASIGLLTAPVAVLVDAISYLGSAALILGFRVQDRRGRTMTGTGPTAARAADPTSATVASQADDVAPTAGGVSVATEAAASEAAEARAETPGATSDQGSMRSQIMDGLRYIGSSRFFISAGCRSPRVSSPGKSPANCGARLRRKRWSAFRDLSRQA